MHNPSPKTSGKAFLIAAAIYASLAGIAFWAIHAPSKTQPPELQTVDVNLAMFAAPTAKPEIASQPNEPKPEPKPEPNEPKPEPNKPNETKTTERPLTEVSDRPVTKPSAQMTPKPSKPIPVKPKFSAQQVANAEKSYLNALRTQIVRYAQDTYPRRAKRRHWQGEVLVKFTLYRNGRIEDVQVMQSSGRSILDDAALSIFIDQMRQEFRSFPAEINREKWTIQVPVSYHLR